MKDKRKYEDDFDEWPDENDPDNYIECWGCDKMIYCCEMYVNHHGLCINCFHKVRKIDRAR